MKMSSPELSNLVVCLFAVSILSSNGNCKEADSNGRKSGSAVKKLNEWILKIDSENSSNFQYTKSELGKMASQIKELESKIKSDEADLEVQTRMAEASEKSVQYTWYGFIVGIIALIISLLVGLFGIIQWIVARKQSRQELRAYIHTDIKARKMDELNLIMRGIPGIKNPPNELIYDVAFQNHGQTPAHKITVHADSVVEKYPHPDVTKFDSDELHDYVTQKLEFATSLGPGAKSNIMVILKKKISAEDIGLLQLRNKAIYVFGQIRYLDSFGMKRHTNFRYTHRILEPNTQFTDDIDNHYAGNDAV
jgi:hypothetical protein